MATIRVAINGFGRIGRLAFRQMFGAKGYKIVAINDLTSPAMLAHLLKYDTAQKGYCGVIGENKHTVTSKEPVFEEDGKTVKVPGSITVDGKEITIYAEPKAQNLPWRKLKVDVVLECTGFYTSKAKAQAHIDAGAKKVVISAPAGNDLPTIVYNVNNNILTKEDKIISAASCTTNCLAPMTKALNDNFPIQAGIMTTVHAYTGDQMILDGPHRKGDLQRARAGAANIVPNSTGAAKAIGLVIPELNGKLIGSAQRMRHQLRAVADAEDRHAELEERRVIRQCALPEHAVRTAGEDDALRRKRLQRIRRDIGRLDQRVYAEFAHPSRNQFLILPAEIDDDDGICHSCLLKCKFRWLYCTARDAPLSSASAVHGKRPKGFPLGRICVALTAPRST